MNVASSAYGYFRVAAISPETRVADVRFNVREMLRAMDAARESRCRLAVFPELSVTGYSCADLFYQARLLEEARTALETLASHTAKSLPSVVGVPLALHGKLYNCAAFLAQGRIVGIVPKTYIPNTREFYEKRWFSSERDRNFAEFPFDPPVPFGADILFRCREMPSCVVGVELCEDLWAVSPPSGDLAACGATLLVNLSASNELLGKADYRRLLVVSQSARCLAAYAYASAGPGESSTDLVFSGHCLIAENGSLLCQSERFEFETRMIAADVDIERLTLERIQSDTFAAARSSRPCRMLQFSSPESEIGALMRKVPPLPFVPDREEDRSARCREIFAIQTTALMKRLLHTKLEGAVIGVSGGLDSTLALLVAAKAFDRIGVPRSNIHAVSMPGFGTTDRTRGNAERLAELLGATLETIPIAGAVEGHFRDIGHDPQVHDVTYENAQARERTQILMDIANRVRGPVIGTGDLSELALGWCTYNGDHMSMYAVNAGVPKTLVRYLVEWCADYEFEGETRRILRDICATPISPELLPPGQGGEIEQKTELQIGPYELHDFFLYHAVRMRSAPRKVFFLARTAFPGRGDGEILQWMRVFYSRFFAHQFKRSCLPDGPKVGTVALSPRGDWRMPSDASAASWLAELDELDREAKSL